MRVGASLLLYAKYTMCVCTIEYKSVSSLLKPCTYCIVCTILYYVIRELIERNWKKCRFLNFNYSAINYPVHTQFLLNFVATLN